MKSIKTYEGFLDFFKRKPKSDKPVYMDDIKTKDPKQFYTLIERL